MEEAASSLGLSPDLSQLRKSIKNVNTASAALDHAKHDAARTFEEVLRKQPCYNSSGVACWLEKLRDIARGSPLRRQLFWAAWHVRRANEKLIGFERGFISEDGLEGREWYRHLGVAPGKWLGALLTFSASVIGENVLTTLCVAGYGATTLPAVAEALTIEKNVTLAEKEAKRLTLLLNKLARTLVE